VTLAPLSDLRVLAVEQYGAGPFGTLQLADLGADVIKVEDPSTGGDIGRYVPPYQDGENSLFFESFNRNKRSVSLDMRHPQARRVFEDLVRASDAVFSNLRGDGPDKLRLRYEDLAHIKPTIVCCSLSGFGMTGPRAQEGAYDWTVQGLAGWQSVTGEPDAPPTKSGLSLADYCGGYVAALAIVAGVWRARREGIGADIDLSLFETSLAQLSYLGSWVASHDYTPVRRPGSAHQSIVPFQNFQTADGWIVVACPKQTLWIALCQTLGHPELHEDERFADFAQRDRNRDELIALLEPLFREATTTELIERLTARGVPCAPVNDIAAALQDPQALARNAVIEIEHPSLGRVRQVATPLRFGDFAAPQERGPYRGEHTAALLAELCGYSEPEIEGLRKGGVLGETPPVPQQSQ
jgi:crotonobetainyl-CoA:carnitine CoA-transferase CaiB-like acyl-CoA transferase